MAVVEFDAAIGQGTRSITRSGSLAGGWGVWFEGSEQDLTAAAQLMALTLTPLRVRVETIGDRMEPEPHEGQPRRRKRRASVPWAEPASEEGEP